MGIDWIHIIATVVSGIVVAVAGKWLNIKVDESQRAKLDWAIKQGVSAAAERVKPGFGLGAEKKDMAIRVAESLAPKAMAKLDDSQKSVLVDATVARMRPTLMNTTFVHHGEGLAQPVDVVAPTMPRPPRMPAPGGTS